MKFPPFVFRVLFWLRSKIKEVELLLFKLLIHSFEAATSNSHPLKASRVVVVRYLASESREQKSDWSLAQSLERWM